MNKSRLGDLAIVTKLAGFEFSKYVNYSEKGQIIALRGINIKNGQLDLSNVKYIDNSDLSKLKRSKLYKNDVLFTYVGTIGESSLIEENNKFYLAPNVALIRLKSDKILPKFLYYYLQSSIFKQNELRKYLQESSLKNIPMNKIRRFLITYPKIEEQKNIITELDTFCDLISTLKDELTLREKQFEYYLNKSLSFDEECTYKTLNEIFNLRNGYTPSRKNESFWQNGNVPWFRMDDIRDNGTILTDSIQHITSEAVKGELFKPNSIILGTSATIGIHALILTDFLSNQRFTNFEIKEEYKNKLDSKFVYYYFFLIDEWCLKNSNKSSFASVDMRKLKKYNFPIPNIEIQKTIVKNLDLLTEYIDLLKQEINLRQKQYEYYRDKLLDFSEEEPE